MSLALAAGIGAAGSIVGGMIGGQGDYYRTVRKRINNAFRQFSNQQDMGYQRAEDAYMEALKSLGEGFGKAEDNVGRFGEASRQRVADRETGRMGQLDQSMKSSGLYNTSMRQSAQLGVMGQADREMLDIDQMLAGMLADLNVNQGLNEAGIHSNIAGLRGNQANARTNLNLQQMNMLYRENSPAMPVPSNPGAAIGGALGFFGGLFGGGFGGGGGGVNAAMQQSPYTVPGGQVSF